MPREEGEPTPIVYEGAQPSGGLGADERQAIYKAIFDLKQEIDALKAQIGRSQLPAPVAPLQEDEAEWQEQEEVPAPRESTLSLKATEEELIRQALEKNHGNRKKAAEQLGMSERTLYRKLPEEYRRK